MNSCGRFSTSGCGAFLSLEVKREPSTAGGKNGGRGRRGGNISSSSPIPLTSLRLAVGNKEKISRRKRHVKERPRPLDAYCPCQNTRHPIAISQDFPPSIELSANGTEGRRPARTGSGGGGGGSHCRRWRTLNSPLTSYTFAVLVRFPISTFRLPFMSSFSGLRLRRRGRRSAQHLLLRERVK